jgi:hypothetical protein
VQGPFVPALRNRSSCGSRECQRKPLASITSVNDPQIDAFELLLHNHVAATRKQPSVLAWPLERCRGKSEWMDRRQSTRWRHEQVSGAASGNDNRHQYGSLVLVGSIESSRSECAKYCEQEWLVRICMTRKTIVSNSQHQHIMSRKRSRIRSIMQ